LGLPLRGALSVTVAGCKKKVAAAPPPPPAQSTPLQARPHAIDAGTSDEGRAKALRNRSPEWPTRHSRAHSGLLNRIQDAYFEFTTNTTIRPDAARL